jgi:hypothetical protein
MSVVVPITWAYVPMFVPMLFGAFSVVTSVAAVATGDSCSCHHHHNAGGGFVVDQSHDSPWGIAIGLPQEHTMHGGYVDMVRDPA